MSRLRLRRAESCVDDDDDDDDVFLLCIIHMQNILFQVTSHLSKQNYIAVNFFQSKSWQVDTKSPPHVVKCLAMLYYRQKISIFTAIITLNT